MNKIVCLCGSTKFKEKFEEVNRDLTLAGYIVLAPGVFGHSDNIQLDEATKQQLDEYEDYKVEVTITENNTGSYAIVIETGSIKMSDLQ